MALLASTLAVNGASSKGTPIVKDVSFSRSGDTLEVKIVATDVAKYTYFELGSPHRLVVDFHGIQNEIGFRERQIDSAGVERVRASFFSDNKRQATRVVFDLTEGVSYDVSDDSRGTVRIVFAARPALNLTAGPPIVVSKPAPAWLLSSLPPVAIAELQALSETLAPPAAAPLSVSLAPAAAPLSVSLAPAAAPLSVSLAAPSAPPATLPEIPPAPAAPQTSPAGSAAAGVPMAPAVSQAAPEAPVPPQTQTNIVIVPPPTPQLPLASPQPVPQYTGELVSFDLTGMSLADFFRLIGEISGLNIVLDPGVTGTIPVLRLTEVPWDQALDIVLRNFQLTGQLQGNVLRIATNSQIQAEETARRSAREAQELAAELSTRTYILNYTTAAAAAATLSRVLTPRGGIIQDARRNALIISDIPGQFARIEEVKNFLDTPAQQVEIEARLLSANKSFSREVGMQLGFLFGNRTGNVVTGVPTLTSPVERTPPPRVAADSGLPLAVNLPAAATSGLAFLIQPGGDVILDAIITAAEARGTAKLLSRPKVMTQNNQPATISQGTQIPVQTNVNNTISTQFLAFNLQLDVTPQITDAGTILLTVLVENSQPDFARAVSGIPSVSTQRAQTMVLIPDGATAVIGGILLDQDTVNIRQVPGLGSLPVIGHLFKNTSTLKSTAELMFFITARVKPQDAISVVPPVPPPGGPNQQ
jgi:type IV pilus assembly protein PilQ